MSINPKICHFIWLRAFLSSISLVSSFNVRMTYVHWVNRYIEGLEIYSYFLFSLLYMVCGWIFYRLWGVGEGVGVFLVLNSRTDQVCWEWVITRSVSRYTNVNLSVTDCDKSCNFAEGPPTWTDCLMLSTDAALWLVELPTFCAK